jgi:rare lipoprotein A
MYALTGAHRTLPLGTVARVTNAVNGRHVVIKINDRGPYVNGRILDLSYAAARELNMVHDGVTAVHLEVIGREALARFGDRGIRGPSAITRPTALAYPSAGERLRHLPAATARTNRPQRALQSDVLRERRPRRAADALAAGSRSRFVAALHLA